MPEVVKGMGFVGSEPGKLYQIGPSTVKKTAAGNPIVLNDSLKRPLKSLKAYGHSEQVVTTGAQLFDASRLVARTGNETIEISADTKDITITGHGISNYEGAKVEFTKEEIAAMAGRSFTISCEKITSANVGIAVSAQVSITYPDRIEYYASSTPCFNVGSEAVKIVISLLTNNTKNIRENMAIFKGIMINEGTQSVPWEPYSGGVPSPSPDWPQPINSAEDSGNITVTVSDGKGNTQSATFQTPSGLRGIPVASGGNYTDANGQQWICDTIEYDGAGARYVQRVGMQVVTSEIRISKGTFTDKFSNFIYEPGNCSGMGNLLCNYLPFENKAVAYMTKESVFSSGKQIYFRFDLARIADLPAFEAYITELNEAGKPLEIIYPLANPITIPLTAEEADQIKALTTYKSSTVITNDAGADMSVIYAGVR